MYNVDARYEDYINKCISLVRSVVIKSDHTIEIINNYLRMLGHEPGEDPEQWKYYVNLRGEYHFTDAPVYVTSSDTGEEVLLSMDNLLAHPLTASEYGPNGLLHAKLLEANPASASLIRSIFNPVPFDKAFAAADHAILHYNANYVGEGEGSLITELQGWVAATMSRWHNPSYSVTDPLYMAARIGTLYQQMVPAVMSIRLRTSQTPQASDFHIWVRLASKARLDKYKKHLSHAQALYLYRNIDYLRHNVGKESTMTSLLANITEPNNIAAMRYGITQTEEHLIDDRKTGVSMVVSDYTSPTTSIDPVNRRSVAHLYDETADNAIYNRVDVEDDVRYAQRVISATTIDVVPTGLVEMVQKYTLDERLAQPDTMQLHTWLDMAGNQRYRKTVTVPINGRESIVLTMRDTAVLLLYSVLRMKSGDTAAVIPDVLLNSSPAYPVPDVSALESLMEQSLVTEGVANTLLSTLPAPPDVTSVTDLSEYVDAVVKAYYQLHSVEVKAVSMSRRAQVRNCVRLLIPSKHVSFVDGVVTWDEWAYSRKLPSNLTTDEYTTLFKNILDNVVGIDSQSVGMSAKSSALVNVVQELTSYGVNYIKSANRRAVMPSGYADKSPNGVQLHHSDNYHIRTGTTGLGTCTPLKNTPALVPKCVADTVRINRTVTLAHVNRGLTTSMLKSKLSFHVSMGSRIPGESTVTTL